jgi:hypothetical protein
MEENTWDAAEPAPLDADTVDALPEGAVEAFASVDAALEVLLGIDWSALSPGEVRAALRGIMARQDALASLARSGRGGVVSG